MNRIFFSLLACYFEFLVGGGLTSIIDIFGCPLWFESAVKMFSPDAGYFRFRYRYITGYRTDTPLLKLRGLNI